MVLAFYMVNNSKGYGRDTFAHSTPSEILDKLEELPGEEWYAYDLSLKQSNHHPALDAFVEDYNNEVLDLGWWCVAIDTDWR